MADRPILFSAPMVRALLDGRKTQTRRIVKDVPPQPAPNCHPSHTPQHPAPYLDSYCGQPKTAANPRGMSTEWMWWQVDDRQSGQSFKVKYKPGDTLWVREAYSGPYYFTDIAPRHWKPSVPIWYWADGNPDDGDWTKPKPGIHMPRWASRLTLTVTDVRVQRLQDISKDDAVAEGLIKLPATGRWVINRGDQYLGAASFDPRSTYAQLWDEINGAGAWDANPWIAAYTFTVAHRNIDAEVPHDL